MEVDINRLIGLGLTIQEYMILYLMYNDNQDVLDSYMNNIEYITMNTLQSLADRGYLTYFEAGIDRDHLDYFKLTDKFKTEVLKVPKVDNNITFEEAFEQLREHYPTKVIGPNRGVRRLQSDIDRCKKLYKKIIIDNYGDIDIKKHQFILQCIDFEVIERKRGKNEAYWQLLPTYLNQRGWELVEEDVKKLIEKNGTIINTSEDYVEDRL